MLNPLPIQQPEPQGRAGNRTFVGRNNGQNNDCENTNPRKNAGHRPIVIDQPVHDLVNKPVMRRPLRSPIIRDGCGIKAHDSSCSHSSHFEWYGYYKIVEWTINDVSPVDLVHS